MTDSVDPIRYHRAHLAARRADRARLAGADLRLSRARLATALLAVALLLASLWQGWLSAWWLAAPAALFAVLVVVHNRVIRLLQAASRRVGWHELGLARLEDRWVGRGGTARGSRTATTRMRSIWTSSGTARCSSC